MSTIQLRRYELIPELADQFLAWFPRVVAARQQHGFTVLFALHNPSSDEFTWAVSHDGDFDEIERVYMASPERAAVFEGQPTYTKAMHISRVERLTLS